MKIFLIAILFGLLVFSNSFTKSTGTDANEKKIEEQHKTLLTNF